MLHIHKNGHVQCNFDEADRVNLRFCGSLSRHRVFSCTYYLLSDHSSYTTVIQLSFCWLLCLLKTLQENCATGSRPAHIGIGFRDLLSWSTELWVEVLQPVLNEVIYTARCIHSLCCLLHRTDLTILNRCPSNQPENLSSRDPTALKTNINGNNL